MSLGHIPVSIDTKSDIHLARKLTSRGICVQEIGASYEPILVTKSQIKSPASEGGENLQYTETSVRNRNVGP